MKTVEVPLLQFIDKVVDISVVAMRQVQVAAETVEIPQLLSDVQIPQVQVVPETVEIPRLPFDESLTGEISTFQLELRMDTMRAVEQEVFAKVGVACVKDNTAMVAREVAVAEKANHEIVVRGVVRNIGFDSFIDDLSSTNGSNHQQRT